MIAKMATNEAKPNGYLFIPPGKEKEFLAPMPVGNIPGVGEHTQETLKAMGIKRIGDVAQYTEAALEEKLGKWGAELWQKSQGIHHGVVSPYHEAKSVSTENTFDQDQTDQRFLMSELVRMCERVAYELRKDNKVTGCIAVKIRYPDFETTSKQTTISYTSADDEIIPVAKELFHQLHRKGMPIRLLGVRLSELTNEAIQTNLFSDAEKKSGLYKAIDEVKNKFGKKLIKRASSN
jgi:DNA polymerase IV